MFSSRVPAQLHSNALSRAIARARLEGRSLIDLTLSNPAAAGCVHPAGLFGALAQPGAASYDPEPFGLQSAREAVAGDYARRGVRMSWDRIALTSSTSEAYSLLFKLLCAPCGDSVLVPAPSYPLFDHLTALDGVAAVPYQLTYDGRWWVDFGSVETRWDARTRALLAVSPNNPTGSVLTEAEIAQIETRCARSDAALIVDEVFADYVLDPSIGPVMNQGTGRPPEALTFRLGGLSKSAALPQVKLGWIAVDGPDALVAAALERLELICDTYLSVSTPVQLAASAFVTGGGQVRRQVQARVGENYDWLCQMAASHPSVSVLPVEAGWSAILRVPSRAPEDEMVVQLVDDDSVIVHPGFFFDFSHEAFLVVSLLPEPDGFREGVRRVLERVNA